MGVALQMCDQLLGKPLAGAGPPGAVAPDRARSAVVWPIPRQKSSHCAELEQTHPLAGCGIWTVALKTATLDVSR